MKQAPLRAELRIRLLDESDRPLYQQLYGDDTTMHHVGPPLDAAKAARSFVAACRMNRVAPPKRRFWVIQDDRTGLALGLIGLHWDAPASAELGVILPPERQGQGIATAAIRCLLPTAFETLGLERLHTWHAADHGLAGGLMASLGFEALKDQTGRAGRCWQLTASQWRTNDGRP